MYNRKVYETTMAEILASNDYQCQFCGASQNIEIYLLGKKNSKYKVGDMIEDKENLIVLCRRCHLELEALKRGRGAMVKARNKEARKKRAWILYQQGLNTREVGKIVGRSHAWVALIVKEFEKTRVGLKVDKKIDNNFTKDYN